MQNVKEFLTNLSDSVIAGNKDEAMRLTNFLIDGGYPPKSIIDDGLMPGMEVVGRRFRDNEIFVPQVLISARAMKSSIAIIEPLIDSADVYDKGTIIIGTVKGDIHDIGKNIVAMMLRSSGYKVIDLGIDTHVDKFIAAVKNEGAQILGMSALLTTTMTYMKVVIEKAKMENLSVKIIVGGAPISKNFSDQIGADGFGKNASEAINLVNDLIGVTN
jgi:5-methyltetrahydrofolate--homocysteine methyltransferase